MTDRLPPEPAGPPVGLERIDHVVGNVEEGKLDDWVRFYEDVMGFRQLRHFDEDQIATEYSALRSTVVWDGAGITMPLNEPADGLKRSQIQEYLDTYAGPACSTSRCAPTTSSPAISSLRVAGVRFIEAPTSTTTTCAAALNFLDLPWDDLEATRHPRRPRAATATCCRSSPRPITDRPTVFFEIIERHGATGFGEGNFKALFEAIERDQARRGNLERATPLRRGGDPPARPSRRQPAVRRRGGRVGDPVGAFVAVGDQALDLTGPRRPGCRRQRGARTASSTPEGR